MTTIALDTLETTREPIRTLSRHRSLGRHHLVRRPTVPELASAPAEIAVGDAVSVAGDA